MSPNVTSVSYNRSHNQVVWEEPFTLNITDVEPDIFNYTICTSFPSFTSTDTFHIRCINKTKANIIIPKFFVNVSLTISAWNIVGESNRVDCIIEPACSIDMASGIQGKPHLRVYVLGTLICWSHHFFQKWLQISFFTTIVLKSTLYFTGVLILMNL